MVDTNNHLIDYGQISFQSSKLLHDIPLVDIRRIPRN